MRNMLIALSLVVIITGCAGTQPTAVESSLTVDQVNTKAAVADRAASDRLIKSKAKLKLETERPDSVHRELINLTDRYHGHLLHSDLSKTTMRIPEQSLQVALIEIEAMGKLLDRQITGGDITEMYKDFNQRLEQLMRRRDRLVAEIRLTTNSSTRKQLEFELDEVDAAIAQVDLRQDSQAHEIYYALVNVETKRHKRLGAVGWVVSNAVLGIKKLFVLN